MIVYTKDHNQIVVFTTPECDDSTTCRNIAMANLPRLLEHAAILRMKRESLLITLSNCNTTNPFKPITPKLIINLLKMQLAEVKSHVYIDMRMDNCHLEYRTINTPDNHKFKVTSTFKYVEIIHGVVDTLDEAKAICDQTRERFKKRIEKEKQYLANGVSSSNTTIYWLTRQLNEEFTIKPVTIRA